MKRLMFGLAVAGLAATGFGDMVTSGNTVGYSGNEVAAQEWNLIGLPFVQIGDSDAVAFDKVLTMNGVEAVGYYDALDGQGAELQVRDANGFYTSYYYINDADDGTERYDLVGWADGDGILIDGSQKLKGGTGVWLRLAVASGVSFTFAGQVEDADTVTTDFANGWTIMASPFPIKLNLSNVVTTGVEPVGYYEALEGQGAELQVRDGKGFYTSYYYINDADDGTECYNLTGWADGDGFLVSDDVIPMASAFWLKSNKAGTLTFSL